MTFFEYGSNAGLFLKLATDFGFRDVYGLEQSNRHFRVSKNYRESLGMDFKLLHHYIDESFTYDQLPLSDVSLLANFHYHLEVPVLRKLLAALEEKACTVIVVSVEGLRERPWKASGDKNDVESYFRYWKKMGECKLLSEKDDPHPRKMFSLKYQSPKIKRVPMKEIKIRNPHHERTISAMNDYIRLCLTGKDFNIRKTQYYRLEMKRKEGRVPEKDVFERAEKKRNTLHDIIQNGMKSPIIVNNDRYVIDGTHRLFLLQAMGYRSAIVRIL